MEKTIEDLQSRLVFQEDMIESLNKRIVDQQVELDEIRIQLKHLNEKMKSMLESNTADARPPHY